MLVNESYVHYTCVRQRGSWRKHKSVALRTYQTALQRVHEVPPVYEVVQRTVRASQTHKGQPECALEIALLINALLL